MNHNLFYLFPFFFAGMWLLATFLISRFGWAALAEKYEAFTDFTGKRIGIIYAKINLVEYRNVLVLKYNEQGIYLRPIILFRTFHKPIMIPWQEIMSVKVKKTWLSRTVELTIGDPRVAVITLSESLFRRLSSFMPALSQQISGRDKQKFI